MEDNKEPAISAIVLAAGESRRMGEENKLLLPLSGKPLIVHVLEALAQTSMLECIVVLGHEANRVKRALHGYPVTFAVNDQYETGMGSSIHAGVKAASSQVAGYMICLSDMPLITVEEYDVLLKVFRMRYQIDQKTIVVPSFKGQKGNPVLLASHHKSAMLNHKGKGGCKPVIEQNSKHVFIREMANNHVLRDIDTPDAYSKITGK